MTQLQTVIDYLQTTGEVSRNVCIREHYLTRLGAVINNLKKKGWKFKTEDRNGDFIYLLVKDPTKLDKTVYSEEFIKFKEHQYRNPTLL